VSARLAVRPYFRALGKLVVIVGNSQHDGLCFWIFHVLAKYAHFLGALSPMIGIIGENARYRRYRFF
jgi:hypothetical protein